MMSNSQFNFQPVVIIGAARSGTNMLRDLLTQIPMVGTWPCDEINYIWRYGNAKHPTDELQRENVSPAIKSYIRRRFISEAKRLDARWLVEKTCANSLRVNFVDKIVPEAKYVFLVRNGLDVAASAIKRWHAPLDINYIARKAFYIPWRDIPYYGARYFGHRIERLLSSQRRLPKWGPRFSGMTDAVASLSLEEVCVLQWQKSVELAANALKNMPPNRVFPVSYEALVQSPKIELDKLFRFLEIPCSNEQCDHLASKVSPQSVGGGKSTIGTKELVNIESSVLETQAKLTSYWPTFCSSINNAA